METTRIRTAERKDVARIWELVVEFADYVKFPHLVTGSAADLEEALFGPSPAAEALVADQAGRLIGYATFYTTFSTFAARRCVWLEDVYVSPEHRGSGIGKALLAKVASIAAGRGCPRVEWDALDWDARAGAFYESLGAWRMDGCHKFRLEGDALAALAANR